MRSLRLVVVSDLQKKSDHAIANYVYIYIEICVIIHMPYLTGMVISVDFPSILR